MEAEEEGGGEGGTQRTLLAHKQGVAHLLEVRAPSHFHFLEGGNNKLLVLTLKIREREGGRAKCSLL